jgi:hypothetical protein
VSIRKKLELYAERVASLACVSLIAACGGSNGSQPEGAANSGAPSATAGAAGANGGSAAVNAGGFPGAGGASSSGLGGDGGFADGGTGTSAGGATAGGSTAGGAGPTLPFSPGAIYSGVPWLDTTGQLVNAHGVGFIKVDSTYYMVGEQRSGANDTYSGDPINDEDSFTGVSLYSTTDFIDWTFVGTVVKPMPGTILAPPYYGERPKILFNASTKKYVLYIKMLNYVGNPPTYTGYYAVLTSSAIAGPYAYHGNLNLTAANDFQVFQDTDGAQYFVRHQGTLYKLSADGLSIQGTVAQNIQSGEAPVLFKAGSTYFWQSSKGTYWHANDNSYSTSSSLTGAWAAHGTFCPQGSLTWQSQSTAVVPVTGSSGTTYVYVGDRWTNGDLPASTLVIQPLTLSGATESISTYHPAWRLNVDAGTWSDVSAVGTSVNDDALSTDPLRFNYDAGWTRSTLSGCFDNDVHASATTGATASLAFTGTQVLLYSAYDESSGILGVTLETNDGTPIGPEVRISLRYDAPAAGNYLVYASPVQPKGSYLLKVRVTGQKDRYSSGTSCNIDRALVVE